MINSQPRPTARRVHLADFITSSSAASLSASRHAAGPQTPVYYLAWRTRRSLPWLSEEFQTRSEAHARYQALIERGAEAYLETRQRSLAA